uniref:CapA family protein n=1 Tax=candidate division WOR-3 bacterium TaxID=2052148 RepID=A0A7C2PA71_UNCW3
MEDKNHQLVLLAVGDLILGTENPDFYFEFSRRILKKGDIVVGHLEVPHTLPYRDPQRLEALVKAGFHLLSLAGNHIYDFGPQGIKDTIEWLSKKGIAFVGAGMNLSEAKRPAIIEKKGTKVGFLSYNCVGPKESWAGDDKPGCAFVKVITHYELDYACPGGPPTIYTFADPESLGEMVKDIKKLKSLCDIVVVYLHKGLIHTPSKIATYEKEISYAAINAGADLIIGTHAHILKGIEVYQGKVIFHGLGNFVTVVPELVVKSNHNSESWATKRLKIFNFEPDPEVPLFPFHPEARYTIIAKCVIEKASIQRVSFIPCFINKYAQPEILTKVSKGEEVFYYVEKITKEAGFSTILKWKNDEVLVLTE